MAASAIEGQSTPYTLRSETGIKGQVWLEFLMENDDIKQL
jgi:hypothetical protein